MLRLLMLELNSEEELLTVTEKEWNLINKNVKMYIDHWISVRLINHHGISLSFNKL